MTAAIRIAFLLVTAFFVACTSVDVRPVPASAHLDKVCIKFNEEVLVDDLVPVIQDDFANHGIKSVVFKAEKPPQCPFTLSYTADRWWDLAPYLVDSRITVNQDDVFLASGHYHMTGHGGLSLAKWAGTHSKIDPVIDQMLEAYPKGAVAGQ